MTFDCDTTANCSLRQFITFDENSRRQGRELRRRTAIKMVSYMEMHSKEANYISVHNKKPPKLEVFISIP